jgi:beta-galactosidase
MHLMRARTTVVLGAVLLAAGVLTACAPRPQPGSLPATLTLEEVRGGRVAFQNGIAVPTFDWQPREQIDLSGEWRVELHTFDAGVSLTDREEVLPAILEEAAGREQPGYPDGDWERIEVPGTLNPPPDKIEIGAWYRLGFNVPGEWAGSAVTLKFAAVNYLADVWLNGEYLGHHEGGYTPFAFDVSGAVRPDQENVLAVRVDNPVWGTRNDIVPWGLADWWNYGGITQSVWLEATPALHVVRADVFPHLDAADIEIVLRHAAGEDGPERSPETAEEGQADEASPLEASVRVEVLPARVTPQNFGERDVRALVPAGAEPLAEAELEEVSMAPGETVLRGTSFLFGQADRWSPGFPALYVLRVSVEADGTVDELWTSFGLRHVSVDPEAPRVLLNGGPVMFFGVALHDEMIDPDSTPDTIRASRLHDVRTLMRQLNHARQMGVRLIRAGHMPANPLLLMLADRLGFAIWSEIPLYHYTPLTYQISMERGIAQQMLREMALRDMNRPSVLFHGLTNESTGEEPRAEALAELHRISYEIDGTRLTGQAAYGSIPDDPTHHALDVVGFTFYYGVFYGTDAAADTARALEVAHDTYPDKPILILEFGRWADDRDGPERQQRVFDETYPELAARSALRPDGYVSAAVWWTLEDYTTMLPGILVEHFGLFAYDGSRRPVAESVSQRFARAPVAGAGVEQRITSEARVATVTERGLDDWRLIAYLGYGLLVSVGLLSVLLLALVRLGGRAAAPPRRRRRPA